MEQRAIRAVYTAETIRVYQAYSAAIAESAVANQKFVAPPFKLERMTWIKPSFLWMMYRAGWSLKDAGQERILAIDLTREGFDWLLEQQVASSFSASNFETKAEWEQAKKTEDVRVQWDPERDIYLSKLDYRSIQIGIRGQAVVKYANDWIVQIQDITEECLAIKAKLDQGLIEEAMAMLPVEKLYQPK